MKTYIQADKNGEFYNVNAFVAYEGFKHFGFEIEKYIDVKNILDKNPQDIIVGGIGNVRKRIELLGIKRNQQEIDYPNELTKYLNRKIWKSTLEEVLRQKQFNIFIKPDIDTKKFAGRVFKNELDFIGLIDEESPTKILCSEIVNFKTEFRCFIRYKQILDIRRYKGDWDKSINLDIVENAISDFESQPNSYALDFGITDNNKTLLVEVNDGHSLGSYGISPQNYAKFISARWSELTNTIDYLNF